MGSAVMTQRNSLMFTIKRKYLKAIHLQDLTKMVLANLLRWLLTLEEALAQTSNLASAVSMVATHQALNSATMQDSTMFPARHSAFLSQDWLLHKQTSKTQENNKKIKKNGQKRPFFCQLFCNKAISKKSFATALHF